MTAKIEHIVIPGPRIGSTRTGDGHCWTVVFIRRFPMKLIKAAALLAVLAVPAYSAGTVVKGDPSGDGSYHQCECTCTPPVLNHIYCFCICDA